MKKHTQNPQKTTYNWFHVLNASATEPMPLDKRRHQLTRMWEGLAHIEKYPAPSTDDWRVCSDAVNLMETLVLKMKLLEDKGGLLNDAVQALGDTGRRYHKTGTIRLDAAGIFAVRATLEDYATVLETLPHRTMIRCHIITEKRIREIVAGKRQPHDVEIVAI